MTLSWVAPTTNGATITGYNIKYSASGAAFVNYAANTGTSAVTAAVSGLASGVTYAFKVAAYNSVGEGALSPASTTITTSRKNVMGRCQSV